MTQALDYAPPTDRRPSRLLALSANATLLYPLFLLGALYGQWLLSWCVLGHAPVPSIDDPKDVAGARWMNPITALAIVGWMPAACAAPVLNAFHVFARRVRGVRLGARVLLLLSLWAGMFVLLRWDPLRVVYWWFD